MSLTGVGITIGTADADLNFDVADFQVVRVGGVPRSVVVIDDSHLGIAAGSVKQYCFGDLIDLGPFPIEVKANLDDATTQFRTSTTAQNRTPIPLGEQTTAASELILTFPTTLTTGTKLTMSGAFVGDSGIPLANNDRFRATFNFHPDGTTFAWTAPVT